MNVREMVILGCQYAIRFAEDGELAAGETGKVRVAEGLILVDGDQSPDELQETLLHEVIHAVDIKTADEADTLTESQVARVSACLFATLRANPEWALELVLSADGIEWEANDE